MLDFEKDICQMNAFYLNSAAAASRADHEMAVLKFGIPSPTLRYIEKLSQSDVAALAGVGFALLKCPLTENAIADVIQNKRESSSIVGFMHARAPSLDEIISAQKSSGSPA